MDITKPHLQQKFKVIDLNQKLYGGKVPPINKAGFWKKPGPMNFPAPENVNERLRQKTRA